MASCSFESFWTKYLFTHVSSTVLMKSKETIIFLLFVQSDVNTVCFADEGGHLIFSGSDDSYCKVNNVPFKYFYKR